MFSYIRLFVAFALLTVTVGARADEEKSFSRQMNEIKRSGEYVYAESSASSEADAKSACDELLKIEITKYLVSVDPQSQTDGRIVKNIADYDCHYLVQTRGEMIRVFGYIAKNSISVPESDRPTMSSSTAADNNREISPVTTPIEEVTVSVPVDESASHPSVDNLKTEGLHLAKWQIDMLENVVREPDMMQAKKLLNRYKYQNRIKRLGDKSVLNPRPADSFYLIYGNGNKPIALLAPSATAAHYDMLSGTTISLDNYSGNQYYWFQISQ